MASTGLQAVLFPKSLFTRTKARRWLNQHELTAKKRVHETGLYLRYRIADPKDFKNFFTKKLSNGILLVIGQ